jgi:hypothetical protein
MSSNVKTEPETAPVIFNRRHDGLLILMFGALAFLLIGIAWSRVSPIRLGDFKVVYYSSRCLLQHGDPYLESDVLRVYRSEGHENPNEPVLDRQVKTRFFYPPTAFIFTLPFALMGFGAGQVIWAGLLSVTFILAALLVWDLAADFSAVVGASLGSLVLANSFWLLMIGNSAGFAVSLCVIAVWCFSRGRYEWLGVLCLTISLAVKPNDSGLIWSFFLLAGGSLRKHALRSLGLLVLVSLPIIVWVSTVSPHWPRELAANMASFSGVGGIVDPAATGMAGRNMDSLVGLQSDVSLFFPNPRTYDLITYAICLPLLLFWTVEISRHRATASKPWLAIAAIAPLTMLPTYHFQHDAKLLLLTIPGCAMLWARRGRIGWMAMLITTAAIVINGDIFSGIRIWVTRNMLVPQSSLGSQFATAVITRPAPLILLLTAAFFLWAFTKQSRRID